MVSANYDSNTIFKLLHDSRYFCEDNSYWPAFSGIVTDFSYANIHAMCKAFNRCTLLEYLQKCYKAIEDETPLEAIIVVGIFLCCAHFMKMVCKDVETVSKNINQSHYFKNLVATILLLQDIKILDEFILNFYILMFSPHENYTVTNAKEMFHKYLQTDITLQEDNAEINVCLEGNLNKASLYKSSPFLRDLIA